jgi:phospholipid N-methyltransferase
MDVLTYGRFDPKLADTVRTLGVSSPAPAPGQTETDFDSLVHSQAYRTCSVRTKAAIAEHIVSVYFPGGGDLRMADLGAGTGLNSLELLLNPGAVSTLTVVEPRNGYHWHIAAVFEQVRAQLHGRVFLLDQKGEELDAPENDIAMICGVLVMVPNDLREKFVLSAWNNLAPGGLLMALENMQCSDLAAGGRYNAQRCTPHEIDTLLGRLAPIRYFMSTAKRELCFNEVRNQTVFRVIQKPA